MSNRKRKQTMSPKEALDFHFNSLVIDSQQPGMTNALLFTENMRKTLGEYVEEGHLSRAQITRILEQQMVEEIQTSSKTQKEFVNLWKKSGVNIASATYASAGAIQSDSFSDTVVAVAQARAIVDALSNEISLILTAEDIENTYREKKLGLILDFQNGTPFGSNLSNIDVFYNLGVRVVQLTYNLRNLIGDGCTERYKSGLTYFGKEVVAKMNEKKMIIDVSHCSEQVGWDCIDISTAPIMITHSTSNALAKHDRAKNDDLIKAVADKGGFFGVAAIAAFISEKPGTTLDDFVDQVEHIINVAGIDHVGIGSDNCGPGPDTGTNFAFPDHMGPYGLSYMYKDNPDPRILPSGSFDWIGFRPEHRLSADYRIEGFDEFIHWPNITIKLAERGFNEEELQKILGLNYLRVFKDIIGQ